MEKSTEFLDLIDAGIATIRKFMRQTQYQMYSDRYNKIIANLEDLKDATKRGTLVSSFVYLGVIKMIDHNDPDQLENAILNINQFYCNNYRNLA
jgi:hypothetical protein